MSEDTVIEPEVLSAGIDFVSDVISDGPTGENFDLVRKLAGLAAMLGKEATSPRAAASSADGAVFAKAVECKAGKGEMNAEEASEAIIDRKASAFVATARVVIAKGVETACKNIGEAIGSAFGAPQVGYMVGAAVGHLLNKPVGQLVEQGAHRVVEYAQQAYQGVKRAVTGFFQKVTSFLFS